ncbi:hypothetical protein ACIQOW_20925 [Kitasatospora sp. NPDC091335]|uniref:hypothetical protein n=1 Tax=Kitasatospora sp. NPDC091335 TaxID=3364085 RepID=UPI00380CC4B3
MSADRDELDITVPDHKIDDVIQAARSGAVIAQDSGATDLGALSGDGGGDGGTGITRGAIPVTDITPVETLQEVPVAEVRAEDVGTFSLRYTGRVPQLVVTGGSVVPSVITVVDATGAVLAEYAARPATEQFPAVRTSRALPIDQNQIVGCAGPGCAPISLR